MRITNKVNGVLSNLRDIWLSEFLSDHPVKRPSSQKKVEEAICCVLHNVVHNIQKGNKSFVVYLHKNSYQSIIVNGCKRKLTISADFVRKVIDWLCEEKGFTLEIGGKLEKKSSLSTSYSNSYLVISDCIIDQVRDLHLSKKEFEPLDSVLVLKDENKKPVAFELTEELKLIINNLNNYNTLSKEHSVTLVGNEGIDYDLQLKKVYNNNSWRSGGRNYVSGGVVQGMSGKERQRLRINGESVCEIDFKALHPSICAELGGFSLGDHDPYDIFLEGVPKWLSRKIAKLALLIMINSKDPTTARKALNRKIYQTFDLDSMYASGLIEKQSISTLEVILEVESANLLIADWLYSNRGLELQHYDSLIMDDVINYFTQRGELVIPIHDSGIVREGLKDKLKAVMMRAYKDVLGSTNNCILEEK